MSRPFSVPTMQPQPRSHRIAPELREALWMRCGGLCECCEQPLTAGWQAHHRLRRSQGGDDSIYNLVALHGYCHRRIHGHVRPSQDAGFLVRSTDNPAAVPLLLHFEEHKRVRLTDQGTYLELAA